MFVYNFSGLSTICSVSSKDEEDEEESIDALVKKADIVRSIWGKKVGLSRLTRKSTTPKGSVSSSVTDE